MRHDTMKKILLTLAFALSVALPSAKSQDLPPVVASDPPPVIARVTSLELEQAKLRAELYMLKAQVASIQGKKSTPAVVPTATPARVVQAPVPFEQAVVRDTIPTTSVTTVVPISTRYLDSSETGLTYTLVPGAGIRGTTSGCSGAGCAVQTNYSRSRGFGLFRR